MKHIEDDDKKIDNNIENLIEQTDDDNRNSNYTQYYNNRFTEVKQDDNLLENPLDFEDEIQVSKKLKSNNLIQYTFKIIILGEISVGKTSFLQRFVNNDFKSEVKSTLTAENYKKTIRLDNSTLTHLILWDTVGEERYRTITRQFYTDSYGAIILYDISNKNSFLKAEIWIKDVIETAPPDCIILLIGNKSDLNEERKVDYEEGKKLAEKYKILFFECSAKIGNNIALAFERLTYKIVEKQKEEVNNKDRYIRNNGKTLVFDEDARKRKNKKCCI
jgi:small GTP-binding protein